MASDGAAKYIWFFSGGPRRNVKELGEGTPVELTFGSAVYRRRMVSGPADNARWALYEWDEKASTP